MKKKLIIICAAVSVILLSTSVATAIYTVDPEAFAAGTDISNAFWGVTLSALGGGDWNGGGPAILAVDPTGEDKPFNPPGDLAFGTDDKDFPHLFWGGPSSINNDHYFRADFNPGAFAEDVSLVFIGNATDVADPDYGVLEAYDAGGTLVDSAFTGALFKDDTETLTVADAGGIAYILAFGANVDSVKDHSLGLDSMEWTAIPAPGAILLGSIGIGLVGWLRRRRTL
jgi:hypothetical protein